MSALADQLKALGLGAHDKPNPADALQMLQLASFGKVARVVAENGYGFLSATGEDVFFHFKGFRGRLPHGQKLPPVETPVIFIIGSRLGKQGKGAILWAPASAWPSALGLPPTDQASLDDLRRQGLGVLPWDAICQLLEAPWYQEQWPGSRGAPADLTDPVLEAVVFERFRHSSAAEPRPGQLRQSLERACYKFAKEMLPDSRSFHKHQMLQCDPIRLTTLGTPDAWWMRSESETTQLRLLEWHLLSRAVFEPRGDWRPWLLGTQASEVAMALRLQDTAITPDSFTCEWLCRLAKNELLSDASIEVWAERSLQLAFEWFDKLLAARQISVLFSWRNNPGELDRLLISEPTRALSLLVSVALAIDLETDGERIWEVGCARNGQAVLLHDERRGTPIESAMADLGARIRAAPLLVGHNVLAWDWPIVARFIGAQPAPLIWDTLLIQYLFEPYVVSHALGGSHRANADAQKAAALFGQQLHRLPWSLARGVLVGEFTDTAQLLDAIAEALLGSVGFSRKAPDLLAAAGNPPGRLVIVPEQRLREFDWVSSATVVAADPTVGLAPGWRQIDLALLEKGILDGGLCDPTARVVLAVARLAEAQGIALRRNMLPEWLLENDARLISVVDAACLAPAISKRWRIAAMPESVDWWIRTDLNKCAIVGLSENVLVLDRRQVAATDNLLRVGTLPVAPFLRIEDGGPALLWVLVDRPEFVLDSIRGFRTFRTLLLRDVAVPIDDRQHKLAHRPVISVRRHYVLYPGAQDQAEYWAEVLRTFREVAVACTGKVPILLVGSSQSRELLEMLETGLAELAHAEVKPAHRSRREHLLRASRNGHALVSALDQWRAWQSLAESIGTELLPVIEALPVEEWYACEQARQLSPDTGNGISSGNASVSTGEAIAVDAVSVLEKVPTLMQARLYGWLFDVGLSTSQSPVVIIDSRIGVAGKGLAQLCELRPLAETPLSDEESQKLAIVMSRFKVAREEAPTGVEAMEAFLIANWQPPAGKGNRVAGFKPTQRSAMEVICARNAHVLVSLPTGEGKSVLFQVPALCRGLRNRRLTLVLSPLKALMRDQVERLRELDFAESADYLSGDRPPHEMSEVLQGVLDHRIVLLYVAPERMRSETFLGVLYKRMHADGGLEHVVVDETHCVNQWGYEFRPDYFHALDLLLRACREKDATEPTPFLLLSATITASDRERLQALLSGASGGVGSPLRMVCKPDAFSNPIRGHIAVRPRHVRGLLSDRREFENALAERLPLIQDAIAEARQNGISTGQRSAVLVFVSSRTHAEVVAQRLAKESGGQVDYYHAGLDATAREDIYKRFLDGDLDVLVATKAFGMGMDIPDIHWVVHLSPPSYAEDYLQEVGRIGRGEKEREKAGLNKLSAMLLFSERDFETIRSFRARNALSVPVIKDVLQEVEKSALEFDGQRVAIVPSEGYESPGIPSRKTAAAKRTAATRMRMALYWLERAGRLSVCGSIQGLITVTIHFGKLQELSKERGAEGEIARLILSVEASGSSGRAQKDYPAATSNESASSTQGDRQTPALGFFGGLLQAGGRLLAGLADTVGVLFGRKSLVATRGTSPPVSASGPSLYVDSPTQTVALNLSQIKLRSSVLKSIGDVWSGLANLEKLGGVSLNHDVQIVPRQLASEPPEMIEKLFDYVDRATAELFRRLKKKGRIEFNPFELVEGEGFEVTPERRKQYERAFINGFRCLARASGVKVRQLVREQDKVVWGAILAPKACWEAELRFAQIRKGSQLLFSAISGAKSIPLSKLVAELRKNSPDGRFRESDLKKATLLLSAMSLVSISPDLNPLSHVVVLSHVGGRLEDKAELWEELKRVNDLAEVRNLAMEVFANIETQAHPAFIEGYFATSDAQGLKQFLESQLVELVTDGGDEGISTTIMEMREKLRATKAVEFFADFEKSEEPAQWEAAQFPFDRHALVNAGPGAGKTKVLVGRIAHLIRKQDIDPSQIVVLAFNRAVVFEIRRRVRELFKSLGYAAYGARLRVSTFHSFAIRNLDRVDGVQIGRSDVDSVLKQFSDRMEKDPAFRQSVAGSVRTILIDEFQDVNDHVYAVIRNLYLGSGSKAGVMAIGDDDQDILRWQRLKERCEHQFSERYFGLFEHDFGREGLDKFLLSTNFRSDREIVDLSQRMISKYFESNTRSCRLKKSKLRPHQNAGRGTCNRIVWVGRQWDEAVDKAATILQGLSDQEGKSTAVLCRSNAEVAEAHRVLSETAPNLTVQGTSNLRVADLRHVGMWLDYLREEANRDDRVLSKDLKREIFRGFAQSVWIPEKSRAHAISLKDLWELSCEEQAFPHLSTLVRFVEALRTDDLGRLFGRTGASSTAVVSTLHKVKGLEFDNVIILPSTIRFGQSADIAGDAAEEARLLYVGMTRAKHHLSYFVGDRERSWREPEPKCYAGTDRNGRVLEGSMDDVWLEWAMQSHDFNRNPEDLQRYIESEVAVGDRIELGGKGGGAFKVLMHQATSGAWRQVGYLAKKHGAGEPGASLKVSAVVRFRPDAMDGSFAGLARTPRWGYAVLVSGRLR